ncbi:MAG: PA2779 family protein [Gammaproteobacteria bacterium]|nr:PA2779 family protein [Gammaproteobacteria bacterium]
MLKAAMKRFVVLAAGLGLLSTTFAGAVNAAMVGTQSAVTMEQRAEYVSDIKGWLAQDNVQQQLVELGVDPASASERVAGMTAAELQKLHTQIDQLPAGAGVIEVIGIVFVVLLILELVGVTNIFSRM